MNRSLKNEDFIFQIFRNMTPYTKLTNQSPPLTQSSILYRTSQSKKKDDSKKKATFENNFNLDFYDSSTQTDMNNQNLFIAKNLNEEYNSKQSYAKLCQQLQINSQDIQNQLNKSKRPLNYQSKLVTPYQMTKDMTNSQIFYSHYHKKDSQFFNNKQINKKQNKQQIIKENLSKIRCQRQNRELQSTFFQSNQLSKSLYQNKTMDNLKKSLYLKQSMLHQQPQKKILYQTIQSKKKQINIYDRQSETKNEGSETFSFSQQSPLRKSKSVIIKRRPSEKISNVKVKTIFNQHNKNQKVEKSFSQQCLSQKNQFDNQHIQSRIYLNKNTDIKTSMTNSLRRSELFDTRASIQTSKKNYFKSNKEQNERDKLIKKSVTQSQRQSKFEELNYLCEQKIYYKYRPANQKVIKQARELQMAILSHKLFLK